MKTRAIQLTVVLMLIAATAFAQKSNNVQTSVILKGNDKVEIRMMNSGDDVAVLNVFDGTHKKVYTGRYRNNNLLITHHIAEFPNGVYTYEIKCGKDVVSSTDIVKASGKELYYKPMEGYAEAR